MHRSAIPFRLPSVGHRTRLLLYCVGLLLFALAPSKVAFAEAFFYERQDVTLDIKSNGEMDVTERLQVQFTEPRRGILRMIPYRYDTGKGVAQQIWIDNISVTDENGRGITTKVSKEGDSIRIRMGDADITLPAGTRKTYVLRYRVDGMLNPQKLKDWDPTYELYWNAINDGSDVPTDVATITLRYPTIPIGRSTGLRVYYGNYGSKNYIESRDLNKEASGSEGMSLRFGPTESTIERTTVLPPRAGITVVLALPDNLIAPPTFWQWFRRWVMPNLGFGLPLLVLPFMFIAWVRGGRDPKKGPMVVQFDPPDGLTGPELGTFLDERVDQRDIAAGIISLAVKGYVRILPTESGMLFKRTVATLQLTEKSDRAGLTHFENLLLSRLASAGNTITPTELRTHVAPYLADMQNSLYESLVTRGYYPHNPNSVKTAWVVGGLIAVGIVGFLGYTLTPAKELLPWIVGGVLSAGIVVLFGSLMPRRTHKGVKTLQLAEGFQEFMRRARADDLQWLSEKHPDAALFEAYLPHAVALGVTEVWAKAFANIMHEMPEWYGVPRGTPYSYYYFGHDFTSMTNDLGNAAAVPPRSSGASGGGSGFGGGGFSGGGFGGGGSSSW